MYGRTGFEVNMLVQQAELQTTRAHNVAAIGRLVTSDESKDRALAGAIATHKSDVLAWIDLQRRAPQDILNAIRLMNF